MYLYFDKQGNLREIINTNPVRQGSYEANKLYVYVDGDIDFKDIWIRFQLPDDSYTNEEDFFEIPEEEEIPYDENRDLKHFKYYTKYKFYVYTLPPKVTSLDGLVSGTIRFVTLDDTIFALGLITFNVEKGVVAYETDVSQSQFDYIIKRVSNFIGHIYIPSVSDDGVISWTNNAGLVNPEPINIMGKMGKAGEIGNVTATATQLEWDKEATAKVTTSGTESKKNLAFEFGIPKGEDGIGGIVSFEVNEGNLIMYYATEQKPDIYLVTKDNYSALGVDKSLIGHLIFMYK